MPKNIKATTTRILSNKSGRAAAPLPREETPVFSATSNIPAQSAQPPSSRRRLPWTTLTLTICALCLGDLAGSWWPLPHLLGITSSKALVDGSYLLQPGPWGNLEALPIYIEPPEEYLPIRSIEEADRRWRFEGFTTDQLTSLFQSADLTDSQRAELLDSSKWQQDAKALYVSPSKDLVLSLSPKARKQIYGPLTAVPDNIFTLLRCSYPADRLGEYFSGSGLSDETIALVKKLSYPYGHLVFFCDMPLVLDTLQTNDEKVRLVKTLLRKSTLLLRLHIAPDSNIDDLTRYWSKAGQEINVQPLLESLSKIPHGTRINVSLLFPPLPTAQLYSFPFPSTKPEDQHKDCHYTALNFFRDPPDPRFTDANVVRQTLLTDYYPALSDPRYGDILVLSKPDGSIIHSCVFIADNIVYTKNSANFRDPYLLMTIPDMLDVFQAQIPEGQSLQLHYYRNKYY